jgi:hypothetical protein
VRISTLLVLLFWVVIGRRVMRGDAVASGIGMAGVDIFRCRRPPLRPFFLVFFR